MKGLEVSVGATTRRWTMCLNTTTERRGSIAQAIGESCQPRQGRSYGVGLMAQRSVGNTTGWVSYTWAKSLRTFDRPGQELNGGREFLAGNDKRHNFNIVVVQRLGQHWKLSASWTYQSGRRGILANTSMYGQFLYFLPLPHGHGSLRPTFGPTLIGSVWCGPCGPRAA